MPFVPVEAAGVVDQHSDGTELFGRLGDQAPHLRLVGQICPKKNRPPTQGADFRQGLFGLVLAAVEMNGQVEALLPKPENDRST